MSSDIEFDRFASQASAHIECLCLTRGSRNAFDDCPAHTDRKHLADLRKDIYSLLL